MICPCKKMNIQVSGNLPDTGKCPACGKDVYYTEHEATFSIPTPDPPLFDPEIHHIERRGRYYYVMDKEAKVARIDKELALDLESNPRVYA